MTTHCSKRISLQCLDFGIRCSYVIFAHPKRQRHPLQYSSLENPMDGGAWWVAVHGVVESQTGLSDFTFTFHHHALEKKMATHSIVLAWRILGTGEPDGLLSIGSQSQTRLKRLSSSSSRTHSQGPLILSDIYQFCIVEILMKLSGIRIVFSNF